MTKVYCIGEGLVTPLGSTVEAVLDAAREGLSRRLFEKRGTLSGASFFEEIAIEAARKATHGMEMTPRTGLVLSTTKGNVEHIGKADISLAASARNIADAVGITTSPIVVSNACISGIAALLQGCLKALSPEPCRPFDKDRQGLNLGEAAAAIVLSAKEGPWEISDGVIRNDANHISGPSRTGEGSYKCLRYVMESIDKEDISFVSVHGTATPYNDEMESIALHRAGLSDVPINALKGVFGHTLGAAGILEAIVSMAAFDKGIVLPTKGFHEMGVSYPVNVSAQERPAKGKLFIKLLSGFGGVNGAMVFRKGGAL